MKSRFSRDFTRNEQKHRQNGLPKQGVKMRKDCVHAKTTQNLKRRKRLSRITNRGANEN